MNRLAQAAQAFQENREITLLQHIAHGALVDRHLPGPVQLVTKVGFARLEGMEFIGLVK